MAKSSSTLDTIAKARAELAVANTPDLLITDRLLALSRALGAVLDLLERSAK